MLNRIQSGLTIPLGLALVALAYGGALQFLHGQEARPKTTANIQGSAVARAYLDNDVNDLTTAAGVYQVAPNAVAVGRNREDMKKVQKILTLLQSEDASESQRDDAKQALSELLSEPFDKDIEMREEQVEQLEERIDKLKAQIAKRKRAKDRLIELQIEVLINDLEGLGFPGTWNQLLRSGGIGNAFFTPAQLNYNGPSYPNAVAPATGLPRIPTGPPQPPRLPPSSGK